MRKIPPRPIIAPHKLGHLSQWHLTITHNYMMVSASHECEPHINIFKTLS